MITKGLIDQNYKILVRESPQINIEQSTDKISDTIVGKIQIKKKQLLMKAYLSGQSLAKWLSVCLRTNWLWIQLPLLSLKLKILPMSRARSSLTLECKFTLKRVRDMIITYS